MMRHPAIRWVVAEDAADAIPPAALAEIDATDQTGCTALHYAVWRDDASKAHLLLENGADVNRSYGEGWTALVDAAWLGHLETVRVLLAHGADVTWVTTSGHTALDVALGEGHSTVVEALQARRGKEDAPPAPETVPDG
jgi:ankyrin repeat protein